MVPLNRRDLGVLTFAALGVADAAFAKDETGASEAGISYDNAAIHQEIVFEASASRLYRALTDAGEFDQVTKLSAAMNTTMKARLGTAPTEIESRPGGAFSLFGGYITGRNLELVAEARIVQAWRSGSWDAGLYSVAQFVLVEENARSRLVFDHKGFPNAAAGHLAEGWHINYWQPLAKYLA